MASVDQNIEVISSLYQAFGQGNIPGVLALVDENATWANIYGSSKFPGQWGKPSHNHAEIMGFFQAINETVEVQGFEIQDMIAQGDKVVAICPWRGFVRRNGAPFADMLTHIWTLRDGKVVDYKGLHDPTLYDL